MARSCAGPSSSGALDEAVLADESLQRLVDRMRGTLTMRVDPALFKRIEVIGADNIRTFVESIVETLERAIVTTGHA